MLDNETANLSPTISTDQVRRRARRIRRRRGLMVATATTLLMAVAGGIYATTSVRPPDVSAVTGPSTLYYSDGTTVLARLDGTRESAVTAPVGLVVNHVLDELSHTEGSPLRGQSWESIENGNYAITTTIDPRAQRVLEETVDPAIDGSVMHGQPDNLQAAGAVVEPGTGRVLAYYGGPDGLGSDYAGFYVDEQGEATGVGWHPPGATFMVYTLAAALKAGYSLQSQWQWTPHAQIGRSASNPIRNASICTSNRTGQACSLLESTTNSLNVPLYDVTASVGPGRVLELARDAGIDHMWTDARERIDLRTGSVAQLAGPRFDTMLGLGQYPVTVLDQANAMATFSAGGRRAQAHFVRTVARAARTIYSETLPRADQPGLLAEGQLADLSYALTRNSATNWLAAKTGTWEYGPNPDQNAHAWDIGYSSALATAIWVGNKAEERPLHTADGTTIWGSGLPGTMLRLVINRTQEALGLTAKPLPTPVYGGDLNPPGSLPS